MKLPMHGIHLAVKPCRLSFDSFNEAKIMTHRGDDQVTIGNGFVGVGVRLRGRARSLWAGSSARGAAGLPQDIFLSVGKPWACIIRRSNATSSEQRPRVRWRRSTSVPARARRPTITVEAKTWVVALACRKAKELGYPHECGRRGFWPAMPASMDR